VRKTVLVYGLAGGLLIAALKAVEYRWLVVGHSLEIYGGLIAAIFASAGVWLGLKLKREKVVVRDVPVEVPVEVPATAVFVLDERRQEALGITARELEVLGLIAAGLSNKEIADRLFVSETTVKTHAGRVLDKLDASRRTQAVQKAREHRLIP
jgi:NarL family two-component system response regulator LiaR